KALAGFGARFGQLTVVETSCVAMNFGMLHPLKRRSSRLLAVRRSTGAALVYLVGSGAMQSLFGFQKFLRMRIFQEMRLLQRKNYTAVAVSRSVSVRKSWA